MVCPEFCSDVSDLVFHSYFFPAQDGTPIQEHLGLSQDEWSSVGEVWLSLLPAERRGVGRGAWAAPGRPLLCLCLGELIRIPCAHRAPGPV